jgi:hypothetical protein
MYILSLDERTSVVTMTVFENYKGNSVWTGIAQSV